MAHKKIIQKQEVIDLIEENQDIYEYNKALINCLYLINYQVVKHSLNVYNNVKEFLPRTKFKKNDYTLISNCALAHDIGKIFGSNLDNVEDRFYDEAFKKEIHFHCIYGYIVTSKYNETISYVCLYHHTDKENYGAELSSLDKKIIDFIKFCDIYTALQEKRSYKNSYSKKQIEKLIKENNQINQYFYLIDEGDSNE